MGRFGRRERKKNRSEKSAFVVERTEDEVETIDRWVGLVGGKERKKERKDEAEKEKKLFLVKKS